MSETLLEDDREDSSRSSFEEEHLQVYLERVADILKISNPKYRINFGTKVGDNYNGVIYRVLFEGERDRRPVKIETILKVATTIDGIRRVLPVSDFYTREHVFYTEIVPAFEEFLKSKNKSFESVPRCYFSAAVDRKEVVFLEDLRAKGFVMRDRIKQMDYAHLSLALRTLGRLHALSFALRDQRPEVFESKIAILKETLHKHEVVTSQPFITRFEGLGNIIRTALAGEDPKYTERFSKYAKNALSLLEWSCDGRLAEPYAVLGHGDFWMNNMLFKYEEDSSDPRTMYLLDFQFARYASPVLDLSYIFFCNCSQELRTKHYDELIRIYHDSLSAYLSELGSDPKKLFPYDALIAQLDKFSVYGAGMAMLVLSMFTAQGADNVRLDSKNGDLIALEKRIHRDHFWRNTTRDTFKDLIDRNYI